jgi:outer membrane protein TolC
MKLRKSSFFILLIFLFFPLTISGYTNVEPTTLTLEEFYYQILQNHPVARQAALLSEQARMELRVARGFFDPTFSSRFYRKVLGGDNYFTLWNNTLRVPIWFLDLKAQYERNVGFNVSGENFTTAAGLTSIGIALPLGQDLFIDQRRATLRQAQLLGDLAVADRIQAINMLLLDATTDYWDWVYAYYRLQINQEGLDLAQFRMEAVGRRVQEGFSRSLDTVEAKIQVQTRKVLLDQALVEYQNASLMISNYLWTGDDIPLEITDEVVPGTSLPNQVFMGQDSLQNLFVQARLNHPQLQRLRLDRQRLDIQERLLRNRMIPSIHLEYNLVQVGFPIAPEVLNFDYMGNNYRFWLGISFPLFLRGERGRLQLNRIRVQEVNLDLRQTEREIITLIQAYYNELKTLNVQVYDQENLVRNSEIMRNAEHRMFVEGESTLFLVNTREMDLIANQQRLYELQTRFAKTMFRLQWAAGTIPDLDL